VHARAATVSSPEPSTEDADRIRTAYVRRTASMDPGRYLPSRPGNALALAQRERILDEALARRGIAGLHDLEILEVGCGTGGELSHFVARDADPSRLFGIDLRPDAIDEARLRVPDAHLVVGDATRLPYPDQSFDLVYQAVALSSMPSPTMRRQVAAEMRRVARPGGLIVSYDFAWNPINRDTVGIDERELRKLFPALPIEIHRVTLVPPLGRWLGDRSERTLRLVSRIRPLRTHRLAIIDVPG
jgi:ubiquinone/menaquinone biosynthesis C-methylase UbiE